MTTVSAPSTENTAPAVWVDSGGFSHTTWCARNTTGNPSTPFLVYANNMKGQWSYVILNPADPHQCSNSRITGRVYDCANAHCLQLSIVAEMSRGKDYTVGCQQGTQGEDAGCHDIFFYDSTDLGVTWKPVSLTSTDNNHRLSPRIDTAVAAGPVYISYTVAPKSDGSSGSTMWRYRSKLTDFFVSEVNPGTFSAPLMDIAVSQPVSTEVHTVHLLGIESPQLLYSTWSPTTKWTSPVTPALPGMASPKYFKGCCNDTHTVWAVWMDSSKIFGSCTSDGSVFPTFEYTPTSLTGLTAVSYGPGLIILYTKQSGVGALLLNEANVWIDLQAPGSTAVATLPHININKPLTQAGPSVVSAVFQNNGAISHVSCSLT
jgi:hypothetical protein